MVRCQCVRQTGPAEQEVFELSLEEWGAELQRGGAAQALRGVPTPARAVGVEEDSVAHVPKSCEIGERQDRWGR